ncbi:MAG TPA: DNA-processing protein DprA [Steroidobacteraceae bacterium]
MEPDRLRALLARTPGLLARHVFACLTEGEAKGSALPPDLPTRLLSHALPERGRAWLSRPDDRLIDSDLLWINDDSGQILICADAQFPATLTRWRDAPAALYVRGSPALLRAVPFAMTGGRQVTPAGIDTARGFAAEIARSGLSLAAGVEEGIDTAAHEGVLAAGGSPIGLSVCGLDRIHPACNAGLVARIRARGTLLSVFAPGTPPRRHHFPIRGRLLGALGSGLLVVEAAGGTGTLSSVEQARALQRPVFAIPGAIRDPAARGCNQLIRAGAILVTQPGEILQELGFNNINQSIRQSSRPPELPGTRPSLLDNKYEMLLDAAGFEPVDIDVLVFRTGWSGHEVASMLLLLELQGRVALQPGGRYCRLS